MNEQQRGQLMLIATSTLGLCLLVVVCGFMTIAVRAGDGEATRLITDNLWQLVLPLVGVMGGIVGVSHFGGSASVPAATASPSTDPAPDNGGA